MNTEQECNERRLYGGLVDHGLPKMWLSEPECINHINNWPVCLMFTHWRSEAKRGVCLLQCLFVCQFVCSHANFRTIKRRMMKLGS